MGRIRKDGKRDLRFKDNQPGYYHVGSEESESPSGAGGAVGCVLMLSGLVGGGYAAYRTFQYLNAMSGGFILAALVASAVFVTIAGALVGIGSVFTGDRM